MVTDHDFDRARGIAVRAFSGPLEPSGGTAALVPHPAEVVASRPAGDANATTSAAGADQAIDQGRSRPLPPRRPRPDRGRKRVAQNPAQSRHKMRHSDCTQRFARIRTIDVQALRQPALPQSLATLCETLRNQPAERTGFEPVDQLLTGHVFSKDAHSTTLPPLPRSDHVTGRLQESLRIALPLGNPSGRGSLHAAF